MIKIDLNNTYDPIYVSTDLDHYVFEAVLKDDSIIQLHVNIVPHFSELLPNVYNFAFGPLNEDNEINDAVKLKHKDIEKLFSTLIFFGLTFLNEKSSETFIGIDGSDDFRATLYHKMFKANMNDLGDVLSVVGVDWYVRLLRDQMSVELDNDGNAFFKPRPEPFDLQRESRDLYRYYMYKLN